jgi:sugar fermentation stimulation protein A
VHNSSGLIKWPILFQGSQIKRYQRFKAGIRLKDSTVNALCPNTGSMLTCCETGRPVYISCHDNPSRKLKYTWEMIEMPGSLVGINTGIPNVDSGVEVFAYDTILDIEGISINNKLPVRL